MLCVFQNFQPVKSWSTFCVVNEYTIYVLTRSTIYVVTESRVDQKAALAGGGGAGGGGGGAFGGNGAPQPRGAFDMGIFSLPLKRLTQDNALLFHHNREPDIAAKVGQHSNTMYKRSVEHDLRLMNDIDDLHSYLTVGGQPVIFLTSLKFEIQKFFTGLYFCCHLYLIRGSQRRVYVSFCLENEWLGYTTIIKVHSFYGFGRMNTSLLAFVHL
jgi:hypothetical protein